MRPLAVCLPLACLSAAFAAAPPAAVPSEVQGLIDRLGSEDEGTRQAASRKLDRLGARVLAPLREAARSHADPDTRLRAAVLAAELERRLTAATRVYQASGWVYRCAVTPDGKKVVCTGDYLRVYDLATGRKLLEVEAGLGGWGLSLSGDSKRALASNNKGAAALYDLETGKAVQTFPRHGAEVWVATLSPDGQVAVLGAMDRTLRAWDTKTGKALRAFADVPDLPRCAAFAPDGRRVAVGHYAAGDYRTAAGTLRLWDVRTGRQVRAAGGHTGAITAVAYSPDGKTLATSSFDRTVRVWDAETLRSLKRLTVSDQACDGVAFTRDGRGLVTAGWESDRAVRLWDLAAGRELLRYDGHGESVLCVAVTPDGRGIVSAARDGTLRLWPLAR